MDNIQAQVNELMAWKAEKERQQISNPIDSQSLDILSKDVFRLLQIENTIGASGIQFPLFVKVKVNNTIIFLQPTDTYTPFTTKHSVSNVLLTSLNHGLISGQQISLQSTQVLPTGLSSGTIYYVIATGLTNSTFEISTSLGGSAVTFSADGTGVQYFLTN